ncbi:hypothetical protein J4E06_06565 [Muricauda sp. NFXS6]|uniref:hypothetical protein n=1 Tax=Allomuricauda sp. NFXS6 TaxID=2819094 RepID=UPI0032DFD51A
MPKRVGGTVIEEGTTNDTSADFDGNYAIEVSSNAVLMFYSKSLLVIKMITLICQNR